MKSFLSLVCVLIFLQGGWGQSKGKVTEPDDCPGNGLISQNREGDLGPHYVEKNGMAEQVDCFEYPVLDNTNYLLGDFKVSLSVPFIPGEGNSPTMYLFAHEGGMNIKYGLSAPLSFEYIAPGLIETEDDITINLEEYFSIEDIMLCSFGNYGDVIYIDLVKKEGEEYVLYDEPCLEVLPLRSAFSVCCMGDYSSLMDLNENDLVHEELVETIGIKALEKNNESAILEVEVYPNPFKDHLILDIKAPNSIIRDEFQVEIFNTLGQKFKTIKGIVQNGIANISTDLEFLPNGIYFCIIKMENMPIKNKVLKYKLIKN